MPIRLVVFLAVVALLAATVLVIHDSFYAAIRVRPEDVGASDLDIVVRGVIYLGLPVAAAAVAAAGVLVGIATLMRARRANDAAPLPVIAVGLVVLAAAAAAVTVSIVLVPGFVSFAAGSGLRLVGALIIVLAFAAVLALTVGLTAGAAAPSFAAGWLALVVMTIAAVPTLLLARSAGDELARSALRGERLDPGAFDPLQVRAGPACILPREPEASVVQTKNYVRLGESSAGALLYDQGTKRAFHVSPERLGVLGVADEVCRVPGDAVPLEVGTPAEDAALARMFRPLLLFDSREPWRPVSVERFVAETYTDPPTRHQLCFESGGCQPIGTTADLSGGRVRLNVHGRRSDGADYRPAGADRCQGNAALLDCESDASAIYYRVTRQDRRVYVDYWWFLRYNHFPLPVGRGGPCGGRPTPKSQHEGDWEGVTVVTRFDQPRELDYVLFAAHSHSFRYRREVVDLDGKRPRIYVACGSHAAYPQPCDGPRGCRQSSACRLNPCKQELSHIAEAPADGKAEWHRNEHLACFTKSPCLIAFPTSPGGRPEGWPIWSGRWGIRGGPRSPAHQTRFTEPWETVTSNRVEFDPRRKPGVAPQQG